MATPKPSLKTVEIEMEMIVVPDSAQYNDLAAQSLDRTVELERLLRRVRIKLCTDSKWHYFPVPAHPGGAPRPADLVDRISERLGQYSAQYRDPLGRSTKVSLESGAPEGIYYYNNEQITWCRFFLSLAQETDGVRTAWVERVQVQNRHLPASVMLSIRHDMLQRGLSPQSNRG